jgi:hypothetical protein
MQTPLTFFFAFIVIIILLTLAAALVIAFVKWIGARKTDIAGFEIVRPGGGMRRGIIRIAEGVSILLIIASTLIGAVLGAVQSYLISGFFAESQTRVYLAPTRRRLSFSQQYRALSVGFCLLLFPYHFCLLWPQSS